MKPSEYAEFFVDRVAQAAVEAWQNRKPAGLSRGLGYASVGTNRRATYFDGKSVLCGNTDAVNFSHVVQIAGQDCGYLPTGRAVKGGGYSAETYRVGPEGGRVLVDETVKQINAVFP